MKLIDTREAVGHVLCHDMTQIIPGVTKDARFRKGHIVTEEDIPVLLSMGKEHLYVWEKRSGWLHEDDAAERLCTLCRNENMHPTPVKEGKIELIANCDGLFQVDVDRLNAINGEDDVMIATRHTNTAVHRGDKLAGTRIIPLIIEETKLRAIEARAGDGGPILSLTPWKLKTCGLITTGSEVAQGRIADAFTPVVVKKLSQYGIAVEEQFLPGDHRADITAAALACKAKGVDLIICTGGMSVDPDDRTPGAIRDTGAEIVSYGAPVLPGAMFLLGYFWDRVPILGLPGCAMYAKATIFDLVLPRLAAGIPISRGDLKGMGHGGLCLGCQECHYPICPFGKGA